MERARAISERGLMVLICSLLMAFEPAFGSPNRAIGTVTGNGEARLNGSVVPNGTVLYTGDRIVTTSGGAASIHLTRGDVLALGSSTAAQVKATDKGFTVLLDSGRVAAAAGKDAPIVVESHGVTIVPKQTNGSYEVALNGSELEVLTHRGTTLAEAANRTVEVPEGRLMRATVDQGPTPAGKKSKLILVVLIAAGVAAAGLGVALEAPSRRCVSATGLSCP